MKTLLEDPDDRDAYFEVVVEHMMHVLDGDLGPDGSPGPGDRFFHLDQMVFWDDTPQGHDFWNKQYTSPDLEVIRKEILSWFGDETDAVLAYVRLAQPEVLWIPKGDPT